MHTRQMAQAHPHGPADESLLACVDECFACAQACTACADACLAEETVAKLVRCIRLNLDCAEVCAATGRVLTRQTETNSDLVRPLLEACRDACRLCAEECEAHAEHHRHCFECARACRACEHACATALDALRAKPS
jgi:hypothetical protein